MIDKGYYVVNCGTHLNDVGYWNGVNWFVMFWEDEEFNGVNVEVVRKIDMGN